MPITDVPESAPTPPPTLAQLAYEAYTATTGRLNYRGVTVVTHMCQTHGGEVHADRLAEWGGSQLMEAVRRLALLEGHESAASAVIEGRRDIDEGARDGGDPWGAALDHLRSSLVCPAWDQLPAGVREAWAASTAAIGRELHARVQCFVYLLTRDALPWGIVSALVHEVVDPKDGEPREAPFLASFLDSQIYSDQAAASLSSCLALTLLELG